MEQRGIIILAAGGTGGHLFPAQALAVHLKAQGYDVHILTDKRARKYIQHIEEDRIHIISSATLKKKKPIAIIKMTIKNCRGLWQSFRLYQKLQPVLVGGFGGYPTLPPLLTASLMKIPCFIHEQNAVMGRANKWLASKVDAIAGGFLTKVPKAWTSKLVLTGNPVRSQVLEAAKKEYYSFGSQELENNGKFRLLIFGGSQGSHFFTQIFPKVFALFSEEERARIALVQQSRGDEGVLKDYYKNLKIEAEIAPFFEDLPEKIADAHFIIARAGASTVTEISVIGRPALLIPYPHALDHDQAENAKQLVKAQAAQLAYEQDLDPEKIAEIIKNAMNSGSVLEKQAQKAKENVNNNAIERLSALVQKLTKKDCKRI